MTPQISMSNGILAQPQLIVVENLRIGKDRRIHS